MKKPQIFENPTEERIWEAPTGSKNGSSEIDPQNFDFLEKKIVLDKKRFRKPFFFQAESYIICSFAVAPENPLKMAKNGENDSKMPKNAKIEIFVNFRTSPDLR